MSFQFKHQTGFYTGKVRDVYTIGTDTLVMIASDRISAFDVILPKPIPYKGQVLNQIAAHMLEATKDICPNWLVAVPAPNASVGKKCKPFNVEMVIRGCLSGHAWRTYASGKRTLCGVRMPEGLKENDVFPHPVITPSTKARQGHDEDISRVQILEQGIVSEEDYIQIENYTYALFKKGQALAAKQGLILGDTKYEFGKIGDTIYLMDEVHTPDSSRYFYAEGYEQRQAKGVKQQQLSKEFVREWLMANGFTGNDGEQIPEMEAAWVDTISKRYMELYERLLGKPFYPQKWSAEETEAAIENALERISKNGH